jgi:soluble lytic murein transglycosylase
VGNPSPGGGSALRPLPPRRPRRSAHRGEALRRALGAARSPADRGARRRGRTDLLLIGPDGVIHFTDTPRDARYRKLPEPKRGGAPKLRVPRRGEYDGLIGLTARENEVEPALVKAVIAAESNFDPEAVSRKGAQGLMQLMPVTATDLGVDDPLRPTENVRGGTRYLRLMLDRYGDLERALAAYNAGPAAVDRYGGIPPYRETQDYVRRVLTYYRHYHGDFAP